MIQVNVHADPVPYCKLHGRTRIERRKLPGPRYRCGVLIQKMDAEWFCGHENLIPGSFNWHIYYVLKVGT